MSTFHAPLVSTPSQAAQVELRRRALTQLQSRDILEFFKATADFEVEIDQFHIEMAEILQQFVADCEAKLSPRLIISAPPRAGKTQLVVRALVPYVAGLHPSWETKVVTHSQDLADMHGRDIRKVMSDPLFNKIFPATKLDPNRRSVSDLGFVDSTGKPTPGSFKCMGISGSLTGQGATILVCDDLLSNLEDARSETTTQKIYDDFQATVMTRIAPGGGVILMATRWTELDPTGRVLDGPLGGIFTYHKYPAYDEQGNILIKRFEKDWEVARKTLDPKIFSSLYMCEPFAAEGDIYRLSDLEGNVVDKAPDPKHRRVYFTCDPAASSKETSDFWTIGVFALDEHDNLTWLDQYHKRGIDSLQYVEALFSLAKQYKPAKILMERCHASNVMEPLINKTMRERREYYNIEYPTTGNKDKVSRSQSIAARVKQGKVKFLRSSFLSTLFRELISFPDGKHDDLADTLAMMGTGLDTCVSPVLPTLEPEDIIPHDTPDYLYRDKPKDTGPRCEGIARRPSRLF